jgi:hypothetical protein
MLLSKGARWDMRTRQRMGLVELVTSGRSNGCKDVLTLVLQRQPALRTLVLRVGEGGSGEMEETGDALQFVKALQRRYLPDMLSFEDLTSLGVCVCVCVSVCLCVCVSVCWS